MKKQEMAFPSEALGQTGMTFRDWFAWMALSGLFANKDNDCLFNGTATLAGMAYIMAEAMLKERNK
jgi:hypothetical protein